MYQAFERPRTGVEESLFAHALYNMGLLYAHKHIATCVSPILVRGSPTSSPCRSYPEKMMLNCVFPRMIPRCQLR